MTKTIAPADLDLSAYIRPGDAIIWGQLTAEPFTLTEAINTQCSELGGIRAFVGLSTREILAPECAEHIDFTFSGGAVTNHRFARDGALNTLPVHLSRVPMHIEAGDIPCDVALIQAAPDDGSGTLNLALSTDYMGAAIAKARTVIAEINTRLPHTNGDTAIPLERIDAVVPSDRALAIFKPPVIGDAERAIGAHIARLVPDRATIQMGIGAIPDAALEALAGKRDIGVHTGLLTEKIVDLIDAGALTNRYKEIDEGICVAAILYGTERLYRWAHHNEKLALRSAASTNSPATLANFGRLFAINSAVEVDLTGQINGEVAASRPVGQVGGQIDYGRAALLSPGGRGIIALRSTARKGSVSTIVPSLSAGIVTTARTDADTIVTEYGIAELAGVPVAIRARRLIAIAHPDFRDSLAKAAERVC
ncbi:MAG: acetyl-CoA hydrolase [Alphaproteobacteria bacterium]|nr:acetyl-CoA hydrolase [Alphaproteobacteria bacterium]